MFRYLCRLWTLAAGWKTNPDLPKGVEKCVMVAAPHTSNMDLIYMIGAFSIYGLSLRFAIKKEWMRFPYSLMMRPLGAIGIDRSPKKAGEKRKSVVEATVNLYKEKKELIVVIAPEGTRDLREKWKTGFYHIAKQANLPIMLGYVDYAKKEAGVGKAIIPSDDMNKDLDEIMDFYKTCTPKYPEKFSLHKQLAE
jgi:1-acyl-sn-glycerol-3-phosphate acyltransferase